jgi:hypothetical protein
MAQASTPLSDSTSSDPERWRITPAGRRFCPMVGFYRNAIETTRADRHAASGCSCRASRSGFTSAMAMPPPTSIMTPHMKKPVLNPSSGVLARSITGQPSSQLRCRSRAARRAAQAA